MVKNPMIKGCRGGIMSSDKLNDAIENWVDSLPEVEQQLINAKRRAKLLEEGPGGIMEMKQTIANKEAEIEELKRLNVNANKFSETVAASVLNKFYYEDQIEKLELKIDRLQKYKVFAIMIANEPWELSYEKIEWQRNWWSKLARKLVEKLESDDE
jgi:hypothetical protein